MIQRGTITATKIDPTVKSVYEIDPIEIKKIMQLRKRPAMQENRKEPSHNRTQTF